MEKEIKPDITETRGQFQSGSSRQTRRSGRCTAAYTIRMHHTGFILQLRREPEKRTPLYSPFLYLYIVRIYLRGIPLRALSQFRARYLLEYYPDAQTVPQFSVLHTIRLLMRMIGCIRNGYSLPVYFTLNPFLLRFPYIFGVPNEKARTRIRTFSLH